MHDPAAAETYAADAGALLRAAPAAVISLDLGLRVRAWNPAAERMLLRSADEALGRAVQDLFAVDQPGRIENIVETITAGGNVHADFWIERRDGSRIEIELRAAPVRNDGGAVVAVVAELNDVTDSRRKHRHTATELERLAWQDGLTRLPNRQALQRHLRELAEAPMRNPIAVVLLDLDDFSLVNDAHGHDAGDFVLQLIADRLRDIVAPQDFVARFGGDEFVVVLRDVAHPKAAAQRLLHAIAEPADLAGQALLLTASAGLVLCPPTSLSEALRGADASMYEAKRQGRAQLHVFDSSVAERASTILQLSGALRRALREDSGELGTHYQPILDLATDRLVALEALARWHHPERGPIPPGRFVDVAAHTGLAAELDLRTIRRAFADYAELVAADVITVDTRISVNIAAAHLERLDAAEVILRAAYDAGVVPRQVMLEVSEDAVARDLESARRTLERLRAQGIQIAVDDFGTGSSSLAHLRALPVDAIKIDRAFVRNVTEQGDDLAIVAAVVDLAHALGITVIAEGVETPAQRRLLSDLKCEQGQGYLWSAPVSRKELPDALYDVARRGRAAEVLGRLRPREAEAAGAVGREHGLMRMMELRREGKSAATIAAALNAEGFRTPEGLRWHRSTVEKALTPSGPSSRSAL